MTKSSVSLHDEILMSIVSMPQYIVLVYCLIHSLVEGAVIVLF